MSLPQHDTEPAELELDSSKFPCERYRPIRKLGHGAAGAVYLCRDSVLKKKVAIKTLHCLDAEQLIAFQVEARATSQLTHPGIVSALDFGATDSGAPYLVMDYVEGQSLEQRLAAGALPIGEIIQLSISIAEALDYAHQRHVYHRDIKPSNVLLVRDPNGDLHARIIDFGVARIKESTGATTNFQGRTLAGTPAYMSPDTVLGYPYDAASEVYSLACVMFEALEGHPPYSGENALSIVHSHAESPVPDISNEDAPDGLVRLVSRMLAKSKGERPATMQAVFAELRSIAEEDDLATKVADTPTSKTPPNKSGFLAIILAALYLTLALLAVLVVTSSWFTNPLVTNNVEKHDSPESIKQSSAANSFDLSGALKIRRSGTRLKLKENELTDDQLPKLLSPDIEDLDLEDNHITARGLRHLDGLKLHTLVLSSNPVDNVSNLSSQTELVRLELENTHITDESLLSLKVLPKLSALNLSQTGITNRAIPNLLHSAKLVSLLNLSNTAITDRAIKDLESHKSLRLLDVSYTNITTKALASLSKLHDLGILGLSGCNNIDWSKLHTLSNLVHLRELKLKFTDVTVPDLEWIKGCKNMVKVDLSSCGKISPTDLQPLVDAMPKCKFYHFTQQELMDN